MRKCRTVAMETAFPHRQGVCVRVCTCHHPRLRCSLSVSALSVNSTLAQKMVTGGFVQMLRKRKELIPLIGIMAFAATGATTACLYFLFTKSDVILNKSSNPEPWDRLDPTTAQKLVTINQQWKPVEELELVKKLTK